MTLSVDPLSCIRTWVGRGYQVTGFEDFGPSGIFFKVKIGDHAGTVIVSQADHEGEEWLHASVAFAERDPSYDELVLLHRSVFGRKRYAYQVFAPESDHVNIHQHALHLWGRADGARVTPDFGVLGTI